jgi:Tfp pilus assembly protein PilF
MTTASAVVRGGIVMSGSNARRRGHARLGRLLLAGASLLLLGTGCMTVDTVDSDSSAVSPARAKRDLGIDYLSSRRTAMAIRELRTSLELDPTDAKTHLWLGEAYRRKGQNKQALEAFENAASRAKRVKDVQTEQDARLNLSALFSQMGRHEEALDHCEALAADPTFPSPWRPLTNCGWALLQLGRYDEARAHFLHALEYFPKFGPALLDLGVLEAKQNHNLAAATAFEKAIASGHLGESGRTEANFRLGELYVALGNREKAIDHFRAAVEMGPSLEWGTQSQAYLDLLH